MLSVGVDRSAGLFLPVPSRVRDDSTGAWKRGQGGHPGGGEHGSEPPVMHFPRGQGFRVEGPACAELGGQPLLKASSTFQLWEDN